MNENETPSTSSEPKAPSPGAGWLGYLPLVGVLLRYRRGDLQYDLMAGLVVAVISVPKSMAYAFLAGLPPQAGLYACLVPMLVYAFFGSSRHLIVGPVAVAALMVAAAIGQLAPDFEGGPMAVTTVICIEAGLFLLLLRVTQMGGVVHLLSYPVITGFINAAAVLIILSQLNGFTGITKDEGAIPIAALWGLITEIGSLNLATLLIAVLSLALIWGARRYGDRFGARLWPALAGSAVISRTAPLLVLLFATLIVALFDLDLTFGVATTGHVPGGLPDFTLPPLDPLMWLQVMPSAAMIAAVIFVESYTIGSSLAVRERRRLDNPQELLALGVANLTAGFSGATPVAGSFSGSSVNHQSGARTPVSSLVCVLAILAVLLVATPLFKDLPQATLAAIVIISVVGLIDLGSVLRHWRVYREDGVTELVTFVTVLAFGVESGLIAGVLLSIAFFLRRSSRGQVTVVGLVGDEHRLSTVGGGDAPSENAEGKPQATGHRIVAIRVDENLFFANTENIESRLLRVVGRWPSTEHVILVCNAINLVDVSGVEMLARLNDGLHQQGIKLHLSEVKSGVEAQLKRSRLLEELTGRLFFTTAQAVTALERKTGVGEATRDESTTTVPSSTAPAPDDADTEGEPTRIKAGE